MGSDPDKNYESELAFWVENASSGDRQLLRALVDFYAADVHRLAQAILTGRGNTIPNDSEIKNLVQGTFSLAGEKLRSFRGQESVRAWLYGLMLRADRAGWVRWLKIRLRIGGRGERTNPTEDTALRKCPEAQIWAGVDKLPEQTRLMVVLRYAHDLSLSDIAQITGSRLEKVHYSLVKARKRLVKRLMEEGKHWMGDSWGKSLGKRSSGARGFGKTNRTHRQAWKSIQTAVDGLLEVDNEEQKWLEEHLGECADCRVYADGLNKLETTLSQVLKRRWVAPIYALSDLEGLMPQDGGGGGRTQSLVQKLKLGREIALLVIVLLVVLPIGWYLARQDTHRGLSPFPEPPGPIPTPLEAPDAGLKGIPQGSTSGQESTWDLTYYSEPAFSRDGRFIAFTLARGTDMSMGFRTGYTSDVFVFDQQTGEFEHVSMFDNDNQNNSINFAPGISADGRWVVFSSSMDYQASYDAPVCPPEEARRNCFEIFIYDRHMREMHQVNLAPDGSLANWHSLIPTISANGRWVAFWSAAGNLVKGSEDVCGQLGAAVKCLNAFLHDRETGSTELIPVGRKVGVQEVVSWEQFSLSADGRWLAFTIQPDDAIAASLGSTDYSNAYIYDRQNATFELVNVAGDGERGNGPSGSPRLTPDGRYLAFASMATNLVAGDENRFMDVFVRDRLTGTTELVSVAGDGKQSNGDSGAFFPEIPNWGTQVAISGDGRFVTFISTASNLVMGKESKCPMSNGTPCLNIYVHDRQSGVTEPGIPTEQRLGIIYLDANISADGRWVSVAEYDLWCTSMPSCSAILLRDIQNGSDVQSITGEKPQVRSDDSTGWVASLFLNASSSGIDSLAFSPDGERLATGSRDGSLGLWMTSDGGLAYQHEQRSVPVEGLAFSPDGRRLASGWRNGAVKVYRVADGAHLFSLDGYASSILDLAFSPDGEMLAVGGVGAAWVWDARDEDPVVLDYYKYSGLQANRVAFSPDSDLLAYAVSDSTVWLRRSAGGEVIARLAAHEDNVLSLAFSPDGNYLASGAADGRVNLWRLEKRRGGKWEFEYVRTLQHADWVNDLAFSPDGNVLAVASFGNGVRLWRIPEGELEKVTLGSSWDQPLSVAYSPDGKTVAVGFAWGGVQFWHNLGP